MAQDFFDRPDLIRLVENDEAFFVAELFNVNAEDANAKRMEGADRGTVGFGSVLALFCLGEQLRHPLLHFARRLVCEGHRQDASGRDLFGDHVGDPMRDDPRLSCAGPGQD